MTKLALHWQILIAIGLAVIAGTLTGTSGAIGPVLFTDIYGFVGTLFLNALKMIIVPLIVSSIIASIASLGASDDIGRLGLRAIGYYALTTLLAVLVGLAAVNIFAPGLSGGEPVGAALNLTLNPQEVQGALASMEGRGLGDIVTVFLRMIPANIVQAGANADMLGLMFFSMCFGFFMTRLGGRHSEVLLTFWQAVAETMMNMTMWIMRFAPIGVFGLVAGTVAATGFAAFVPLFKFFFIVLGALMFHLLVVLSMLLKVLGRVNPFKHLRAMMPALLTAFSSASSTATLPMTMECLRKHSGVSERITNFVLPIGASGNMDGTALYECAAAIFLAQAYGLELSFATQFTVVLLALFTSMGVAGIPAASLVAITVILGAIGLPLEAIGLLLVTDRVLDMVRTAVNVYSDSCCAVVVARGEGEELPIV
jgi:Na+/H+-dicarboxylate symporter